MSVSMDENSSVTDFYRGKSVFITGATGFIGKVLVEKLLYSCKDIDKVYVLVRAKENASSQDRVKDIIAKPIFDRIKAERPEGLNKIVAVPGDILKENLGISSEDEYLLKEKVSVVFHSAANVKFNTRMDVAIRHNYDPSKKILNLCRRMNNLQSLVYMSTAYINANMLHLDEVVYPLPPWTKELETFLEDGVEDKVKLKMLLNGRPNTYTFAKALAESYLASNHGTIPTSIIRPSGVTPSAKEPFPGWVDTWSIINALVAGTLLGYIRVIVGQSSGHIEIIPVDYVTNLAIAAGAKNIRKNDLKIFNSCSSSCNPLTLKNLKENVTDVSKKNGYYDFRPYAVTAKSGIWENSASFCLEKLPSLWRLLIGKKPRYENINSRVAASRKHLKFFTSRSYTMSADNTIALSRSLSRNDVKTFPFNPQDINWKEYLHVYCKGLKKFLIK